MKINVGIIGVGRFGSNYLKTFNQLKGANVSWICSRSQDTLEKVKLGFGDVKATTNYKDFLKDKDVDAVAIITPATTHYKIAKEALNAGKHIIVEKPLTVSSNECRELIEISKSQNKILMAAHIHRYNPGIQKLKEDISAGKLGKINFIHYTHLGNGPIRTDINALWDFFPHTLTILNYFFDDVPKSVSANGACYLQEKIDDIVTVSLKYRDGTYVIATGSWLYPFKRMDLIVSGSRKFAVFDDHAKKEKLKYYDNVPVIKYGRPAIDDKGYSSGHIKEARPLTSELGHFLDCVRNNKKPLTDGNEALKMIKVLEHAQKSLDNDGKWIEVAL
jgi:UDP-2-acetamido-3-amino-2,3-dideoxy-glucuronate N-acetyltransferase